MAKRGRKPAATDYQKVLEQAQKDLEAKKKGLVQAERNLAKAKQKHEELVAEIARLDMLTRSLKAMVDGTEPPSNVKYVYNYPQWVWYPCTPSPYITYTYNGYGQSTPQYNYTLTNYPSGSTLTNTVTCNGVYNLSDSIGAYKGETATTSWTNSSATPTISGGAQLASACLNNVTLTSTAGSLGTKPFDGVVVDLSSGAELHPVSDEEYVDPDPDPVSEGHNL